MYIKRSPTTNRARLTIKGENTLALKQPRCPIGLQVLYTHNLLLTGLITKVTPLLKKLTLPIYLVI